MSKPGLEDPERVRFVLVGPQSAGNVGASARAIRNVGFLRLDLVAPECDPLSEEARRMAVGAAGVLESARVHADLDSALGGTVAALGTSRRRGKRRRPNFRLDEIAPRLPDLVARGDIAFVFGREHAGLTEAELDRCTHLVHLAASAEHGSFNLSQAVLLAAYTTRLALAGPVRARATEPLADHEGREVAYRHLEAALSACGFLKRDTSDGMMRRLRRIFGRAELSPGDVKILRGIARQVLWLARESGPSLSEEEGARPPARTRGRG